MSDPRMPAIHRLLIRCYPIAWRRRYEAEFVEVLGMRRLTARDVVDVLRGALDARLHPSRDGRRAIMAVASRPAGEASIAVIGPTFGIVATPPIGVLSRRSFMRRMLGVGVGLLSLEFLAGSVNFLWPQLRSGLGATFRIGTIAEVVAAQPSFAAGAPFAYNPARMFLVNVPAAMELARGNDVQITDLRADQLLALWRKCPHLGCLVPAPCESVTRYQCRCHRSTYNVLGEKMHEGPAERGLDRFALTIGADGAVMVDTGRITAGPPNRGPAALSFDDGHPWEATCSER